MNKGRLAKRRFKNNKRTYRTEINGKLLVGKGGNVAYFHGTPQAAAKKVVTSLRKRNIDIDNISKAKLIKLIEVTRGIRKIDKNEYFTYQYYGWRDNIVTEITKSMIDNILLKSVLNESELNKYIGKHGTIVLKIGKNKEERIILFKGKNIAIPMRGKNTPVEALKASKSIGLKIKNNKDLLSKKLLYEL